MTQLTRSPLAAIEAPPARGGPTDVSHDERLRRGILHTEISRGVAWALVLGFLAMIALIPIGEAIAEKQAGDDSVLLELFEHAPSAERLRQFEEDLEQASRAKDFVQPRMQLLLTRLARAGNKKAVVGRGGWLYYEPGVRHVYGPGFLDEEIMASRIKLARDADEPPLAPDPRAAILAFQRALASRNIRLIVFPVPDKASVEAEQLHGRSHPGSPIARNRDWRRFVDELTRAGVLVFDPLGARALSQREPRYLIQDTHWTPAWMQQVASQLAAFVGSHVRLAPGAPKPAWKRTPQRVARVGDIVDMLKLPPTQDYFQPQEVVVQSVSDDADNAWEPDAKGEILLLGDSFTNVFSMSFMGWGEAAGFAPQLAFELGRGVDVIAQNDSGAFATREALARELSGGEDRLAGKSVVIWEFASRELSVGNWKPIDWTAALKAAKEGG